MLLRRHSATYNFVADPRTGVTFRWGSTPEEDPVSAPWPELADISISNYCTVGCSCCYRDSSPQGKSMSLADYRHVLDQLTHPIWGSVFQVALGGGEPLEHPDFIKIIQLTRDLGMVPNFTTRGFHVTRSLARKVSGLVGGAAVSATDLESCRFDAVRTLVSEGTKTNIHYLLHRKSLSEAIEIAKGKHDDLLKGVNAVVFLTYKPTGRASAAECLTWGPPFRLFVDALDAKRSKIKLGFDACLVPLLLHATRIDRRLIDPCECGFFSVYIDENLNVRPCSFAPSKRDTYSLRSASFETIWTDMLASFRTDRVNACRRHCGAARSCRGACPYFTETNFCFSTKEGDASL